MRPLLNAYYLQEEAARGRLDRVNETFASAVRLGARVIRTWAFNDDPAKHDSQIQRARLVRSETGVTGLDRVIERARHHGVELILPLVNHWNAYGGARQWLLWNGIDDAVEGDARFFTNGRVRDHYAAHVEWLLGRENPLTGVRYADEPAIFAWELMNEPRGRGLDPDGRTLAEWVRFAARTIKSVAPGQRISVGDEGEQVSFDGHDRRFWQQVGASQLFAPSTGTSFNLHLECPDVDLASCHFYPEKYGVRPGAELEAGIAWIEEHASLATRAGKPLVLGEFAVLPRPERAEWYARWIGAAAAKQAAAAGPWLFAYDERPRDWDEFTFYARDPEAAALTIGR